MKTYEDLFDKDSDTSQEVGSVYSDDIQVNFMIEI